MKKLADISAFEGLQNQAHAGFVSDMAVFNADGEKWRITDCWTMYTEDTYDEGYLLDTSYDTGWPGREVRGKEFDTLDELLRFVIEKKMYMDYDPKNIDIEDFDEDNDIRLVTGFLVDENDCELSDKEMEAWKKGDLKAWGLDLYITVDKISRRRSNYDEARVDLFGKKE